MLAFSLPDPHLNYQALFTALLPLASVLLIAGFWPAIVAAGSTRDLLLTIARFATIVGLIAKFDLVADMAQDYVEDLVVHKLNAAPAAAADRYLKLVNNEKKGEEQKWFYERLLSPATSVGEAMLACILWLFSMLAGCVQALAYVFQKLALQVSYGLAPLFLALLSISSVRSIGVRYLLGIAGIILWPLGWAVASLVTDGLLGLLNDATSVTPEMLQLVGPVQHSLAIFTALIGLWILFSTVIAPLVIQRAITTGAQASTGLVSASVTTIRTLIRR